VVSYGDDWVGPDLAPDTTNAVFRAVSDSLSAGPLPEFGSHDWLQLDKDDPRRFYATVRAALAWWSAQVFGPDPRPDRLVNQASKDVAAGADWPELIRQHRDNQRVLQYRAQHPYGDAA
jgi:hypothetical protein